jgi:predicted transcriptional regulator
MARLTITLSDECHRALREVALKRGETIGKLIEESLQLYGIKGERSTAELVAKAAETRAARRRSRRIARRSA